MQARAGAPGQEASHLHSSEGRIKGHQALARLTQGGAGMAYGVRAAVMGFCSQPEGMLLAKLRSE